MLNVYLERSETLSAEHKNSLPDQKFIERCLEIAEQTLELNKNIELNIKIVCSRESQELNHQYRDKNKPTNVLSFESDLPSFVKSDFIGDLAICADVVEQEAVDQNKSFNDHFTHMCIHGFLHLLGYDHIEKDDALIMEAHEKVILAKLGIDDPYRDS